MSESENNKAQRKMEQDSNTQIVESEYNSILLQAVAVIDESRTKAAKSFNTIANMTYWNIGKLLQERKLDSKYGSNVVKRLSEDLKQRYPNMGFSPRQLWNMRKFYVRYLGCDEKVLQAVALLPWSHNLLILSKDLNNEQTLYYAEEVTRKGWNRNLLLNAIKMNMHKYHSDQSIESNFSTTLPVVQAAYANEVFRGFQTTMNNTKQ